MHFVRRCERDSATTGTRITLRRFVCTSGSAARLPTFGPPMLLNTKGHTKTQAPRGASLPLKARRSFLTIWRRSDSLDQIGAPMPLSGENRERSFAFEAVLPLAVTALAPAQSLIVWRRACRSSRMLLGCMEGHLLRARWRWQSQQAWGRCPVRSPDPRMSNTAVRASVAQRRA